LVLAIQLLFTSGVCLLVSMGNLFFRDVKYLSEVVLMLWMFATSVVYPVPTDGRWGWLLALNPMTPIIDAYRNILLHNQTPDLWGLGYAAAASTAVAAIGLTWFHETEPLFAERI
jgi:ABC-type polysaccharide/polyol phosphate export permease